jgi:cell fate regulator YaaT (PSP1 superfamily)
MLSEEFARGCRLSELKENSTNCESSYCAKLHVYNWLDNTPKVEVISEIVEVRFKNTRKGFYRNVNELNLRIGDIIAVEASPGHDIGIVSLTGDLVHSQLKKFNIDPKSELKKVYRKAKGTDIDKWREAVALEHDTMISARKIASDLDLNMKIGDVEYQGDKTKAIFYYIADDRVDFRELIKVLAERFKIRVEMRQIGARQEAGRIGGVGSCGRELCCSTWITNFVSVTTNAARYQELSLNPQKLAGQCSKLKCCLNYELDNYLDARKDFPTIRRPLKLKQGDAILEKIDIFKKMMWFSVNNEKTTNFFPIHVNAVKEILERNKKGDVVDFNASQTFSMKEASPKLDYENVVGKESLTRFEDKKRKPKPKSRHKKHFRKRNEK